MARVILPSVRRLKIFYTGVVLSVHKRFVRVLRFDRNHSRSKFINFNNRTSFIASVLVGLNVSFKPFSEKSLQKIKKQNRKQLNPSFFRIFIRLT